MPSRRISFPGPIESWLTVPPEGIDAPLFLERLLPPLSDDLELIAKIEAETRALADLPPPFRRIIAVSRQTDSLQILQEHFIGVSGRQLTLALQKHRRLLPIDVWLSLADALCRAWASIPPGGVAWRMVPTINSFGLDVHRRLVIFSSPDHSMLVRLIPSPGETRPATTSHPPELMLGGPLEERTRVFLLATVLVPLLTGDQPYGSSPLAPSTSEAHWRPENHPGCPPALGKALSGALALRPEGRPETIELLRQQLVAAARCVAASSERVGNVVLGTDFDQVRRALALLRADPALLPASWREGGIDVLEDQLLEALVPMEQLPLTRAPAPTAAPPRVNLARPPRRAWWEAIWPFRRP